MKIKVILRTVVRSIFKHLLKIFYIIPIKKNKIFFISFLGKEYACNPKYITEYLLNEHMNKFYICWAFKNPNNYIYLEERKIKILKYNSIKFFMNILSSKVVITNNLCQSFIPFRKNQYIINTWHAGGVYKKVGFTQHSSNWEEIMRIKIAIKPVKLFLSSSREFTNYLIHDSFGYTGEVLKCGLPRNDIFFEKNETIIKKVKEILKIPKNKKIALYAPTHRDEKPFTDYSFDYEKVYITLEQKFDSEWVILIRAHNNFTEQFGEININSKSINASLYPDMQELLLATDLLITDYSSCMWDFSLTYKPCFLYATDLEFYLSNRGLYIDINKWPFPLATDIGELLKNIINFDMEKYLANLKKYHQDMGSYESGNATIQIVEKIIEVY